ncbi:MAG TPA: SurA N-terminal domain-containing protein [Rhizomicrobium sp.]|nr:SurA N-terminal domain-containing protein [Rhizomicrobium sp.]
MIQWMHAFSKHWVVTLMMGALTLAFVVWGMGLEQFNIGGGGNDVASVGPAAISGPEFQRTYRNFLRNQSQRMGSEITPDMAEKMGLGQVALQQMITREALNNEAGALGLTASDTALVQNVHGMDVFHGTLGQFDRQVFNQAIGNAGYSEEQFLGEVRHDMMRDQLAQALEANFLAPPTYAQAIYQYIGEKRAADYVILSPEQAGDVPPPSDAVLTAYVKAHAARSSTPEYRDIDYAAIAPSDVMGSITVTDAQIQQDYDAHKSTYIVPEKRDVQQIEFKTEAEAQAARAKIQAGAKYEDIAAQRGLKPEQMSLGTLAQDELPDPDRAKAIFALPLNEVSQPIKTGFGGYALIRVTKIAAGSSKTLADVKEDIRKSLMSQLAANKQVDAVNAYTEAHNAGDDLKTAAKKAGMTFTRLGTVDSTGLKPDGGKAEVPADAEFLPALFKGEVGEDTDPFSTKLGAYYVVHVNGVTPPKLKPMEQVRAQALADWTNEQRAQLLATKAQVLAAQAAKDKSLDGIARQLKVSVQHSPALARNTNDTMFSTEMVNRLFAAGPGGVEFGIQGLSGNYMIARVTGISHPPVNSADPNFQPSVARFSQQIAQDFTMDAASAGRARQGVKVNQKLLASLTGSGQ